MSCLSSSKYEKRRNTYIHIPDLQRKITPAGGGRNGVGGVLRMIRSQKVGWQIQQRSVKQLSSTGNPGARADFVDYACRDDRCTSTASEAERSDKMGLGIGYEFEFYGGAQEILLALERLRMLVSGLPSVLVSRVVWLPALTRTYHPDDSDKRTWREWQGSPEWEEYLKFDVGLGFWCTGPEGPFTRPPWSPGYHEAREKYGRAIEEKGYGVGLSVDVGEGSEPVIVGLGTLDGKSWYGSGTTKTQYAEDFLESHLQVVAILDICEAVGILDDVGDEGRYWETRDLNVLAKDLNEYTGLLEGMTKALKEGTVSFGEDLTLIKSAVDDCANYMETADEI